MKSKYPIRKLILFNFWLTIYFFLFGFVITIAQGEAGGVQRAISNSIIGTIILILNTFTNLILLLSLEHRLVNNKSYQKKIYVALSYILSLLIYIFVIFGYIFITNNSIHLTTLANILIISILINTLLLVLQNYVVVEDAKVASDKEKSELKVANANAVNQQLRQQIHPHFLFNALNILKSLYKINPKAAEEYLVCLSDFLRASVSNNNTKIIPLKEELKLCQNYIEMQKIRFGETLICSISISKDKLETGFVPPFSIQLLLENAIKHNELTEESPLHISIQQEGNRINVTNNRKLKNTSEISIGSGLENLSERYRILSNDELIIIENESIFSVSIKILDNENSNH